MRSLCADMKCKCYLDGGVMQFIRKQIFMLIFILKALAFLKLSHSHLIKTVITTGVTLVGVNENRKENRNFFSPNLGKLFTGSF